MLRRLLPGVTASIMMVLVIVEAGRVGDQPATPARGYQVAGQFGGASYAVALRQAQDGAEQPPYLILGVGPRLVVLDATNPEQPVRVGQSEILPGVVRALALSGSLVFAATGLGGLQVIDLAEPTQPAVIASYDTGGYLEDLAVAGSVVYLASTPKWDGSNWVGASLKVVDVSDPRQLRLLGGYDTPGYEHGVAAAGGLVFVADGDGGLRVLAGANPAALREVGAYDTPGYALDVATDGEYAYVADFTEGVRVVDVGDPANPKEVGYVETPGKARSVTLSGETVYVADGEGGLRVVEVGQPEGAREVGMFAPESDVRGVAALSTTETDGFAYVADRRHGMRVVDINDPGDPNEVALYDTLGYVSGVDLVVDTQGARTAYVASGGDIRIVEATDLARPALLAFYATPGEANDISLDEQGQQGHQIYVADAPLWTGRDWQEGGLRILEMGEDGVLHEVAFVSTPGQALGVEAAAGRVYLADGHSGLRVLQVSDPARPQELKVHDLPGHTSDLVFANGHVFIASPGQGVRVERAELPEPAEEVGRFAAAVYARGVSSWGRRLFVTEGTETGDPALTGQRGVGGGLRLLDSGHPRELAEIGRIVTPGDSQNVAVGEGVVLVADGDGGLLLFQINE